MKEKIRAMLIKNPGFTMPEVARAMDRDPQNDKCLRVAYWQARAMLFEDYTRAMLNNKDNKGHTDMDDVLRAMLEQGPYKDDKGHADSKGHTTRTLPIDKGHADMPDRWIDKNGIEYIKGARTGVWRKFPYGVDAAPNIWENIEEKTVRANWIALNLF